LLSDDRLADDNAQTLQALIALIDRHLRAAPDRQHFPDPENFPATEFAEGDVTTAIRSFSDVSPEGPDSVHPQHLHDLTTNKAAGSAIVTALTTFIYLLMVGKCPLQYHQFSSEADLSPSRKSQAEYDLLPSANLAPASGKMRQ
jgi:hypothetical protein